ncbi:glycerophosphodiester phosphodiesterase family protein [Porphyrobacter sp. AAP82]|uniref:glycerophosphodiester phosphodiesterase family protein n=1 Tax=Porphyrobacter sp. AAP82 TaxID=1248917 RepID=UPI000315B1AD|nr:glycerophosphodiester phosphodiesterase family protein [Porphyrobacter sp. AAP82]
MSARPAPGWLTQWEFAHRGLHGPGVAENSLAAAEGAIARGMGIECDIQRSHDDHPIVFHDWDLARLTGEAGVVAERTAEAMEALHLLGTGEHPVRLARFLEVVAGRVPLLIEIKSRTGYDVEWTCASVAWLLDSYKHDVAVMSFDPKVSIWFASEAPAVCRGLVGTDSYGNGFEGVWRSPDAVAAAAPDFLAIDVSDLGRPEAAAWRAGGHPLLTWTIRSPATRATGLALADALIAEGDGLA